MRLRRHKHEAGYPQLAIPNADGNGARLVYVQEEMMPIISHLLSELIVFRETVVDLNTRLMELEGDEYEEDQ
jgi:hypothetical protein